MPGLAAGRGLAEQRVGARSAGAWSSRRSCTGIYLTLAWQRAVSAALAPFELTHVPFVLLASAWWLDEHGRTPKQRELARHAGTDVKMTYQVVRRLEARSLVERRVDPTDPRARRLRRRRAGRASRGAPSDITPDKSKAPGANGLLDIVNGIAFYALVAGLIGACCWAVGGRIDNDYTATNGKVGMVVAAGCAFLVGAATVILNFAYNAGSGG